MRWSQEIKERVWIILMQPNSMQWMMSIKLMESNKRIKNYTTSREILNNNYCINKRLIWNNKIKMKWTKKPILNWIWVKFKMLWLMSNYQRNKVHRLLSLILYPNLKSNQKFKILKSKRIKKAIITINTIYSTC